VVLEGCWYVFLSFPPPLLSFGGGKCSLKGMMLICDIAQNFPKARERLEDLKKGGSKASLKSRERISRSKVGKQNEGECSVM